MKQLTEEETRRLVEIVARRVAERLAQSAPANPPVLPASPAPPPTPIGSDSSHGEAPFIMPCAIPPPGSPRYEAVMKVLDK